MRRLHIIAILLASLALTAGASAQSSTQGKTIAERLGYPANSRLLIVHADDFGMLHAVNRGIMLALEKHWVTSASIMVPCPWFPEVVMWAKQHPDADLGIHLTLNADWTTVRWRPISPQPKGSSLLDEAGYLPLLTEDVDAHAKPGDAETEGRAQIDMAKASGLHITHLDPHMGTFASTPELLKVYLGLGDTYHLPVLLEEPKNVPAMHAGIDGKFFKLPEKALVLDGILQMMQNVPKEQWFETYKKMLAPLPPGTYELIVHLAYDDPEMQAATADHPDWGAQWRQKDLDMVSSPEFQQFLKDQHFILVSWKDVAKAMQ